MQRACPGAGVFSPRLCLPAPLLSTAGEAGPALPLPTDAPNLGGPGEARVELPFPRPPSRTAPRDRETHAREGAQGEGGGRGELPWDSSGTRSGSTGTKTVP